MLVQLHFPPRLGGYKSERRGSGRRPGHGSLSQPERTTEIQILSKSPASNRGPDRTPEYL